VDYSRLCRFVCEHARARGSVELRVASAGPPPVRLSAISHPSSISPNRDAVSRLCVSCVWVLCVYSCGLSRQWRDE